jgi:hypothetical protein
MAFANSVKLDKLPSNVLDVLNTLTDLELCTLRAALSSFVLRTLQLNRYILTHYL